MTLTAHGDQKYHLSEQLSEPAQWTNLRVEHRRVEAGAQKGLVLKCTELVLILSGQSAIKRTGDGITQEAVARPGTAWLCPAGTFESQVESSAPIECIHLFLPSTLVARSALEDYGIDPNRSQLSYAGGVPDPIRRGR
jgi:AraC family transcriptional regulator